MRANWRHVAALAIAVAADAVQIGLLPVFIEGAAAPWNDSLDIAVGAALLALLGWHVALLPAFLGAGAGLRSIPDVDGGRAVRGYEEKIEPAASGWPALLPARPLCFMAYNASLTGVSESVDSREPPTTRTLAPTLVGKPDPMEDSDVRQGGRR